MSATEMACESIDDPFQVELVRSWPPSDWRDVVTLVAVSGGADSVALLLGLQAIRHPGVGQLIVAHFNHRLRGAASDAEEAFVTALAERLQLPIETGAANTTADAQSMSELDARRQRYDFLLDAARRRGARFVATAHTAEDQAETILLRILRGTGIAGLAGIPRVRELAPGIALLRPILTIRRAAARDYLARLGQSFCEDQSNADRRFARNRVRLDVLPAAATIHEADPIESLSRLSGLAVELQQAVDSLVQQLDEEAVSLSRANQVCIACDRLGTTPRYFVRELLIAIWKRQSWPLQAMTRDKWDALATLIQSDGSATPARQTLPGDVRAEKSESQIWLSRGTHD